MTCTVRADYKILFCEVFHSVSQTAHKYTYRILTSSYRRYMTSLGTGSPLANATGTMDACLSATASSAELSSSAFLSPSYSSSPRSRSRTPLDLPVLPAAPPCFIAMPGRTKGAAPATGGLLRHASFGHLILLILGSVGSSLVYLLIMLL